MQSSFKLRDHDHVEAVQYRRGRLPGLPLPHEQTTPPQWGYAACAGRLVELSGHEETAVLSFAFQLVREAQQARDLVAWITAIDSAFFPPDVAAAGVDLEALTVVRLPEIRAAAAVADQLLRSGGFGLVVLDLASAGRAAPPFISAPYQGRLVQLAQRHDATVVCLTEKQDARPSLSSMVSLRGAARRGKAREDGVSCTFSILKDKRQGALRHYREVFRAPDGMH